MNKLSEESVDNVALKEQPTDDSPYHLRISRLTVDKLGVKLYDKASAVVAELVANGYDADAENVTVRVPLNVHLATKTSGELKDRGHFIEVEDDGHGMTPDEAEKFYLRVGTDRRERAKDGSRSAMGRSHGSPLNWLRNSQALLLRMSLRTTPMSKD